MDNENKFSVKLQPRKVIKCPHCGWEYLPSEIFYSDSFAGKLVLGSVIRDPLGHILYEEYEEDCAPLAEEHYCCDNCGKPFVVELETKYNSKLEEEELDFSEESVSLWD